MRTASLDFRARPTRRPPALRLVSVNDRPAPLSRSDRVRANVRAILAAADRRGIGFRSWLLPGLGNGARLSKSGRMWPRGGLWWSEIAAKPDGGEEIRRGLCLARWRHRAKAQGLALIAHIQRGGPSDA